MDGQLDGETRQDEGIQKKEQTSIVDSVLIYVHAYKHRHLERRTAGWIQC